MTQVIGRRRSLSSAAADARWLTGDVLRLGGYRGHSQQKHSEGCGGAPAARRPTRLGLFFDRSQLGSPAQRPQCDPPAK
jgi:hypothetical protein